MKSPKRSFSPAVLVIVALVAVSPAAYSAVPGAPIVLSPSDGATVVGGGTCAVYTNPGGQLATVNALMSLGTQVVTSINQQVAAASQVNDANMKSLMTTQRVLNEELARDFQEIITAQAEGQMLVESAIRNDPERSRAYASCGSQSVAVGAQIGETAARDVRNRYAEAMARHRNGYQTEEQKARGIAAVDPTKVLAQSLFPPDGTTALENREAAKMAAMLAIVPDPPINLSQSAAKTPAGRDYENLRKIVGTKLVASEAAMSDILASRQPLIDQKDLPALGELWAAMSGDSEATPPGVTDMNKISPRAFLSLLVANRYQNPNWMKDVRENQNEYGHLEELVLMQAVQLHMEDRQLQMLEYMTVLLAQMQAQSVEQEYGEELEHRRRTAVGTTN